MNEVLEQFYFPNEDDHELLIQALAKMKKIFDLSASPIEEEGMPKPIPSEGCTGEEIDSLQNDIGCKIPKNLKNFLSYYRYLALDDGKSVLGLHQKGEIGYGAPWISYEHEKGKKWLVVGKYWRYADGDDLLMDLSTGSVYAYLHEYRGKIEHFSDTIQQAVYRMVNEVSDEEYMEIYDFDEEI